jgi:hypothetical protein
MKEMLSRGRIECVVSRRPSIKPRFLFDAPSLSSFIETRLAFALLFATLETNFQSRLCDHTPEDKTLFLCSRPLNIAAKRSSLFYVHSHSTLA